MEAEQPQPAGSFYKPGETVAPGQTAPTAAPAPAAPAPPSSPAAVTWTAAEFIEHQRGSNWYVALGAISVGLAGLVYLIGRDLFASITILVVGGLVGVFASRKPKEASYELDDSGLKIEQKLYPYRLFQSFSVIHEDGIGLISLQPVKRFMPEVTVYYHDQDETKIVGVLGQHLPHEDKTLDSIERLSRRLRF